MKLRVVVAALSAVRQALFDVASGGEGGEGGRGGLPAEGRIYAKGHSHNSMQQKVSQTGCQQTAIWQTVWTVRHWVTVTGNVAGLAVSCRA